ncbi:MAG: beta-N-acetylhexosaminidase [Bacillaceae bacterium]|nr:beta-N-acetylhexosaminidase [Bacillaceae bacterium]
MPDFRTYSGKNVTKMMPEIEQLIKEYHLGGVILFAENLVNTEQTVRLVHEFQEAAEKFGLLLTIDQEGGMVTRLQTGTDMPGNMAIGATRSPDLAAQVGNIIGTELAALGINMNLAPVVDINNNPDNPVIGVRSFSEDPKLVAELGIALTDAMQATGVAATAKHFPGHGDTTVDSHLGLPEVPHDKERLSEIELFPFQQLMDSGIDAIMTAHVTFPNIDAEKAVSRKTRNEVHVPATLSHKVLTELMRNEMGFNGVVMTDAMNMKAITDHFGPVDAAVRAINAGADIILMPVGISDVFQGILDAVNSGEIPVNRIDESVERILTLKVTRGILKEETPLNVEQKVLHALQVVSSQEHQKIEADVAAKSITLVKNDTNVLPIDRKENKKIIVVGAFSYIDSLFAEINSRYENVTLVKLESNQSSLTSNQKQQIQESDLVIIGSFTSSAAGRSQTSGLVKAYNEVLTIGKPSVAVALGNPYDVMAYPGVNAYIAQYGIREASFEATADVIFGITKPTGKLPVTIPSYDGGTLFEFGTGLHY